MFAALKVIMKMDSIYPHDLYCQQAIYLIAQNEGIFWIKALVQTPLNMWFLTRVRSNPRSFILRGFAESLSRKLRHTRLIVLIRNEMPNILFFTTERFGKCTYETGGVRNFHQGK